MSIVIVTGVPGVGKSSICRKLVAKYNQISLVNFGEFLNEYRRNNCGKVDCDEDFISYLKSIGGGILVESHGFEKTSFGVLYTPFINIEQLDISCLVLIEAEPVKIYERREIDKKLRKYESLEEIKKHQDLLRTEMIVQSIFLRKRSYMIKNEQIDKTISGLEDILFKEGFLKHK